MYDDDVCNLEKAASDHTVFCACNLKMESDPTDNSACNLDVNSDLNDNNELNLKMSDLYSTDDEACDSGKIDSVNDESFNLGSQSLHNDGLESYHNTEFVPTTDESQQVLLNGDAENNLNGSLNTTNSPIDLPIPLSYIKAEIWDLSDFVEPSLDLDNSEQNFGVTTFHARVKKNQEMNQEREEGSSSPIVLNSDESALDGFKSPEVSNGNESALEKFKSFEYSNDESAEDDEYSDDESAQGDEYSNDESAQDEFQSDEVTNNNQSTLDGLKSPKIPNSKDSALDELKSLEVANNASALDKFKPSEVSSSNEFRSFEVFSNNESAQDGFKSSEECINNDSPQDEFKFSEACINSSVDGMESLDVPNSNESALDELKSIEVSNSNQSALDKFKSSEVSSTNESGLDGFKYSEVSNNNDSSLDGLESCVPKNNESALDEFKSSEVSSTNESGLDGFKYSEVCNNNDSSLDGLESCVPNSNKSAPGKSKSLEVSNGNISTLDELKSFEVSGSDQGLDSFKSSEVPNINESILDEFQSSIAPSSNESGLDGFKSPEVINNESNVDGFKSPGVSNNTELTEDDFKSPEFSNSNESALDGFKSPEVPSCNRSPLDLFKSPKVSNSNELKSSEIPNSNDSAIDGFKSAEVHVTNESAVEQLKSFVATNSDESAALDEFESPEVSTSYEAALDGFKSPEISNSNEFKSSEVCVNNDSDLDGIKSPEIMNPNSKESAFMVLKPINKKCVQCTYCSFITNLPVHMKQHLMSSHSDNILKCEKCNYVTTSNKLMNAHKRKYLKNGCCDLRKNRSRKDKVNSFNDFMKNSFEKADSFKQDGDVAYESNEVECDFPTEICNGNLSSNESNKFHISSTQEPPETSNTNIKSSNKSNEFDHASTQNPTEIDNSNLKMSPIKRAVKPSLLLCKFCEFKTYMRMRYEDHMKIHTVCNNAQISPEMSEKSVNAKTPKIRNKSVDGRFDKLNNESTCDTNPTNSDMLKGINRPVNVKRQGLNKRKRCSTKIVKSKLLKCSSCNFKTQNNSEMEIHNETHENIQANQNIQTNKNDFGICKEMLVVLRDIKHTNEEVYLEAFGGKTTIDKFTNTRTSSSDLCDVLSESLQFQGVENVKENIKINKLRNNSNSSIDEQEIVMDDVGLKESENEDCETNKVISNPCNIVNEGEEPTTSKSKKKKINKKGSSVHMCTSCDFKSKWECNLKRHISRYHSKNQFKKCKICDYSTNKLKMFRKHERNCSKRLTTYQKSPSNEKSSINVESPVQAKIEDTQSPVHTPSPVRRAKRLVHKSHRLINCKSASFDIHNNKNSSSTNSLEKSNSYVKIRERSLPTSSTRVKKSLNFPELIKSIAKDNIKEIEKMRRSLPSDSFVLDNENTGEEETELKPLKIVKKRRTSSIELPRVIAKEDFDDTGNNVQSSANARLKKISKVGKSSGNKWKCKLCNYSSKWRVAYRMHLTTNHDGVKFFKCKFCDYEGNVKNLLKKHYLRYHSSVIIQKCNESAGALTEFDILNQWCELDHKRNLNTSMKSESDLPVSEQSLAESVKVENMNSFPENQVIETKHSSTLKRKLVEEPKIKGRKYRKLSDSKVISSDNGTTSEDFNSSENILSLKRIFKDLIRHSKEKIASEEKASKTGELNVSLENKITYTNASLLIKKDIYKCERCSFVTHNISTFRRHTLHNCNSKSFQCENCNFTTNQYLLLHEHSSVHHHTVDYKEEPFQCGKINKKRPKMDVPSESNTVNDMDNPTTSKLNSSNDSVVDDFEMNSDITGEDIKYEVLTCSLCPFQTKHLPSMTEHYKTHFRGCDVEAKYFISTSNQMETKQNKLSTIGVKGSKVQARKTRSSLQKQNFPTEDKITKIRQRSLGKDKSLTEQNVNVSHKSKDETLFPPDEVKVSDEDLFTHSNFVKVECNVENNTYTKESSIRSNSNSKYMNRANISSAEEASIDIKNIPTEESNDSTFVIRRNRNFKLRKMSSNKSIRKFTSEKKKANNVSTNLTKKIHECSFCDYNSSKILLMRRHMSKCHKEIANVTKCLKCSICPYQTDFLGNLKRHMRTRHNYNVDAVINRATLDLAVLPKDAPTNSKSEIFAQRINTPSKDKDNLPEMSDKALWESECINVLKCKQCNFKSINRNSMISHMKNHDKSFDYNCQSCSFGTNNFILMRKHNKKRSCLKGKRNARSKQNSNRGFRFKTKTINATPLRRTERKVIKKTFHGEAPENDEIQTATRRIKRTRKLIPNTKRRMAYGRGIKRTTTEERGQEDTTNEIFIENKSEKAIIEEEEEEEFEGFDGNDFDNSVSSEKKLRTMSIISKEGLAIIDNVKSEYIEPSRTPDQLTGELKDDLNSSRNTLYKCLDCLYETKFSSAMRKHMISKNHKSNTYSCPNCSFQTDSKELLLEHKQTHSEQSVTIYRCLDCNYITSTKSTIIRHTRTFNHRAYLYTCKKCSKQFCDLDEILSHEKNDCNESSVTHEN